MSGDQYSKKVPQEGESDNEFTDFTDFFWFGLKGTFKKLEKYLSRSVEPYGITLAQAFVLFTLLQNDGCTLTEIANKSDIENSSMTSLVDRLENVKLVERRADATNRRIMRVFITEEGRQLGYNLLDTGIKYNNDLQQSLGDDLFRRLCQALMLLDERLDIRRAEEEGSGDNNRPASA